MKAIEVKISRNEISYDEAVRFMESKVENIHNNLSKELLWFLNHNHVFTQGTSAKNDEILKSSIIDVIKVSDLTESAIYKLRKHVEQVDDTTDEDEDIGDDFETLQKGAISKSGTPILPSKRGRIIPEKIQVSKEDLDELKGTSEPEAPNETEESETSDVSLEGLKDKEAQESTDIKEDTETTNS